MDYTPTGEFRRDIWEAELARIEALATSEAHPRDREIAAKALEDCADAMREVPEALMMTTEMPGLLRKRAEMIRAGLVEV